MWGALFGMVATPCLAGVLRNYATQRTEAQALKAQTLAGRCVHGRFSVRKRTDGQGFAMAASMAASLSVALCQPSKTAQPLAFLIVGK